MSHTISRGEKCASTRSMKRVVGVAWTVIREEGKLVFVLGTPGLIGISIDVCCKEGVGGPTHTMDGRPKVKRRICKMELENAEGGLEGCGRLHA